ncbi:MAG TPA: ABC transporter permease [Longimicrobiales bacterium]|nr:ABC transporter permease [Longimicrobiales bacterium]
MASLEWYIARRYLASRRKGRLLSLITLIAVGGVALGVMALLTVIGVMTGLQRDLQAKILGSNPHVYVFEQGQGFRFGDWRRVLARVNENRGVVAAQPFIMSNVVIIVDGSYARAGTLYGIDPAISPVPLTEVEAQIRSGELPFERGITGFPPILLGAGLAQALTALPGDTIQVASLENIRIDPVSGTPMPSIRWFEVSASFRTGMYDYDNQNMYVPLAAAQDLMGFPSDTVSGIAVNLADAWEANRVADELAVGLGLPYYPMTWMELNRSLFSALKLEKLAMAIILSLIVLVAAFNIVSTLIMVVADKTREIGILKSMGLTRRAVLRIFMLQGVAIGLIGTVIGALGGLGLVYVLDRYELIELPGDVYFVESLPVALDPVDFALIVTLSVLVAFVATIYPARQASRLLPVEAIRHE